MTTTAQFSPAPRQARADGWALTPGAPGYDAARSVWNGMIDNWPALIIRAGAVADVVAAVRTARHSTNLRSASAAAATTLPGSRFPMVG